jgi:hypothetical protein
MGQKINWDQTETPGGLLPEDVYTARLEGVTQRESQAGNTVWKLCFKIAEGKHAGRVVWDNLVWTQAAYPRIKALCASLGLPTTGEVELEPYHLEGKKCLITVIHREWNGNKQASIPFDGFAPVEVRGTAPGDVVEPELSQDDLPF